MEKYVFAYRVCSYDINQQGLTRHVNQPNLNPLVYKDVHHSNLKNKIIAYRSLYVYNI